MNLARRKDAAAVTRIRAAAEERGVPLKYLSKHAMNALADNRPHQGVMLDCGGLEPIAMDELPTAAEVAAAAPGAPPPVWLVLDEVSDPVRRLQRWRCAGLSSCMHLSSCMCERDTTVDVVERRGVPQLLFLLNPTRCAVAPRLVCPQHPWPIAWPGSAVRGLCIWLGHCVTVEILRTAPPYASSPGSESHEYECGHAHVSDQSHGSKTGWWVVTPRG